MGYPETIWPPQCFTSLNHKYITVSVLTFLLILGQFGTEGSPSRLHSYHSGSLSGDTANSSYSDFSSSISGVVISIVLLLSLILVVALCSGGCWPFSQIFRSREPDYAGGFSNPIRDSTVGLSQIDVHALELDPVVFEPLPTLHNLSPQGGRFQTSNQAGFESFGSVKNGVIVPFTTDETNIYAHDWFVEPFHNFPRGNLEYFKEIGKAWFGQVIEAEARDIVPYAKKIKVLVKVLREDAAGLEQMRFLDESRLYRESDHGNVLKLLGHSIEMSPFLLIMESCPQGNLKSYLIANVTRAEMMNIRGDVLRMALDIAKGLEWMANAGFTHGDLAARNCQVGSEGRIVIGDYGLATQMFKDDYYWSSNIAIPLRWAAPETIHCTVNTIQTLKVTNVSNIWTFGICLWEICEFGKLPYFELNDDEVITRVISEKNYVLGHPTMPSLSMRENLCEVMKACWKTNVEDRPSMSEIVKALENSLQDLQAFRRNKNEFDSKWDQFAATNAGGFVDTAKSPNQNSIRFTKSPNELGKRKSVSFFGEVPQIQTTVGNRSTPLQNASNTESSNVDSITQNICDDVLFKVSDSEEEHWRKRIERGDISEKVREKSQSVQDLMVLTHVEQSDLSDPESLILVNKQQVPTIVSTPSASAHQSPLLRRSASETALNSTGIGSIGTSQPVILGNSLIPAEVMRNTITPEKSSGVTINLIESTPSPSVAINIIQPTPSPAADCETLVESVSESIQPRKVEKIKKRFKFIFEEDEHDFVRPESHRTRHTSTPIRTPSPLPNESASLNQIVEKSNVFDSPSKGRAVTGILDESCPISPISKQSNDVFNTSFQTIAGSTESYSILMGASDDLGLMPYQAVTTEMEDRSLVEETVTEDEELSPRGQRKIFPGLSSDSKIFDCSFNSERVQVVDSHFCQSKDIFENENDKSDTRIESANKTEEESKSLKTQEETATRRSQFNLVPRKLFLETSGDQAEAGSSNNSDGREVVLSKPVEHLHSPSTGRNGDRKAPDVEIDDFWSKQMNSVKEATGNTLALFQLGLGQDDDSKSKVERRNIKFVEDIKAANEETESLILHDLEDEKCKQTKIGRETLGFQSEMCSSSNVSGMAFGGSVKREKHFQPGHNSSSDDNGDEGNNVPRKTLNSSIEITKDAVKSGSWRRQAAEDEKGNTESEGEDDLCPGFVPSMWNQNLAPVKPSIKSPEVVEDSERHEPPVYPIKRSTNAGMRKSVSFEKNKTQLVYEYPPQNVSDSEDEDTRQSSDFRVGGPLALALDWELQPDELELEDAQFNNEDWEDEIVRPGPVKTIKSEDVYRIAGVDDSFQVRGSSEPFGFTQMPTSSANSFLPNPLPVTPSLGELRHTRDKLKLDLSRGEASVLDEESKNAVKLDSGVGSSTSTNNISPFSHCDN